MFAGTESVEVYFWTATNRRSRGVLWSIIAPPFIAEQVNKIMQDPRIQNLVQDTASYLFKEGRVQRVELRGWILIELGNSPIPDFHCGVPRLS